MNFFLLISLFTFSHHSHSSSGYSSSSSSSPSVPKQTARPPSIRPTQNTSSSTSSSKSSTGSNSRSNNSNYSNTRPSQVNSVAPPPTVQSSGPIKYDHVVKSKASLTSHLYRFPRNGVTINNIKIVGDNFEVTGVYKNKNSLREFVNTIKGEGEIDRKVQVEKKSTFFAGERTRTYKIIGLNLWE